MLFPKPIGFKFYRDSVRFIGVLSLIAILGFCFSVVGFIRIGVSCRTGNFRNDDLNLSNSFRGIPLLFER